MTAVPRAPAEAFPDLLAAEQVNGHKLLGLRAAGSHSRLTRTPKVSRQALPLFPGSEKK